MAGLGRNLARQHAAELCEAGYARWDTDGLHVVCPVTRDVLMGLGCERAYLMGSKARSPHRAIGGYIASFIADESPDIATYVGIDRLTLMTRRWRSDVSESIKYLEGLGEITVEKRPGRTSLYRIVWAALEWRTPTKPDEKHDLAFEGRRPCRRPGGNRHKRVDGLTGQVW